MIGGKGGEMRMWEREGKRERGANENGAWC